MHFIVLCFAVVYFAYFTLGGWSDLVWGWVGCCLISVWNWSLIEDLVNDGYNVVRAAKEYLFELSVKINSYLNAITIVYRYSTIAICIHYIKTLT